MGHEKQCYKVESVIAAMGTFIKENYRGLSDISVDIPSDTEVFISMESLAMFFDEIFDFVLGRALLKMRFCFDHGKIMMYLSSEPPLPCSIEKATHIIRFARDIGFDLRRIDGKVAFIIDCFEKRNYTVYVPIVNDNVKKIVQIFESVCYKREDLLS